MMMPANYSAIAENEMTYVVGGGLVDVLVPAMTAQNWQTVNLNVVKIIGNAFMGDFIQATLGELFSGNYWFGNVGKGIVAGLDETFQANQGGVAGVLNAGLKVVGGLASIYTLGLAKVDPKVPALVLPKAEA